MSRQNQLIGHVSHSPHRNTDKTFIPTMKSRCDSRFNINGSTLIAETVKNDETIQKLNKYKKKLKKYITRNQE